MKIGILTLPLHTNYGGILQAYALQTILERMGHDVKIITKPRRWHLPIHRALHILPERIIRKLKGEQVVIFRESALTKSFPIVSQNIQNFIDQHIRTRVVNQYTDIKRNEFDAFVVGSDQIWRPGYFSPIKHAFLSFAENWNVKRVAYAASFGGDQWIFDSRQTNICKKQAQKFDAISVREDSGVTLCQKHLNTHAEHVLDPTLLLDKEDYISLIQNAPKSNGTLLNYVLDSSTDMDQYINQVAEKYNLTPFSVRNPNEMNLAVPVADRIAPSVESWLRGFYDAELVVTDSFHACVFSVIFGKNRTHG